MLGVRRYGGIQVDLWQGEIATFVVDATVSSPAIPSWHDDVTSAKMLETECSAALEKARDSGRHLGVAVSGGGQIPLEGYAQAWLNAAHTFCAQQHGNTRVRRITFVLADGTSYDIFQEKLFALFPEFDADPSS